MLLGREAVALMGRVKFVAFLEFKMLQRIAGISSLTLNDHFTDLTTSAVVIFLH